MKTVAMLAITGWFFSAIYRLSAADYQGADFVLQQTGPVAKKSDSAQNQPDEGTKLRNDIKAFRNAAAILPPEQAAREWLALLDRTIRLSHDPDAAKNSSPVFVQEIYLAVPPPPAWDALAKEIYARPAPAKGPMVFPAQALRLLAATLLGKTDDARQAVAALSEEANRPEEVRKERSYADRSAAIIAGLLDVKGKKISPKQAAQEAWFGNNARDLVERVRGKLPSDPNPQGEVSEFEKKLAALAPEGKPRDWMSDTAPEPEKLYVPDLVPVVGAERAEAILRKVFAAPAEIRFACDKQTEALARRVATEMVDQLKFVPWRLAGSLDATQFAETLVEHFPIKEKEDLDGDREEAAGYALIGLAIQGRDADADRLAWQLAQAAARNEEKLSEFLSPYVLREAIYQGHGAPCYALLERLLKAHPEAPAWESYLLAARFTAQLEPALALMKTTLSHEIKGKAKLLLRDAYAHALLAADHAAEGATILRDLDLSDPGEGPGSLTDNHKEHTRRLGKLAELGRLLGDKTLLNQALDARIKDDTVDGSLTKLFLEAGRGPEMERLLSTSLAGAAKEYQDDQMPDKPAYNKIISDRVTGPASSLVEFYDLAGRPQDILKLFDQGRFWPVEDVAGLIGRIPGSDDNPNFGYYAAHALAQVGRPDAALRTLNAFLDFKSDCPGAYPLLLELLPPELAALRMEELRARDGVDGEPMLCRAQALLGLGRLNEAEKSVREALSVLPFDTDPDGMRAQAWSVLADVQTRRGDSTAAAATRRRADAVSRLTRGDEMAEAGLLTSAAAAYQQAHDAFGDDYSVEWKLAQALGEIGRLDEAEQHYRHACELAPASLGRRNLHYWIDADKLIGFARIQAAAEQTLTPLTTADSPPEQKARAHFALGELFSAQAREAEAFREKQAAARLDPDFFDAWNLMHVPQGKDELWHERLVNLLRLDPQRRHAMFLDDETDLRELWRLTAAVAPYYPRPPVDLYPFGASRAALRELDWSAERRDATRKTLRMQSAMDPEWEYGPEEGGVTTELLTPAAVVMSNGVITVTGQFLGIAAPYNSGQLFEEVQTFTRGRPYH